MKSVNNGQIRGRDPKTGKFLPGNPGKPQGAVSGRKEALGVLDEILSESGNKETLRKALQEYLDIRPVEFFKLIVMPLLPKEAKGEGFSDKHESNQHFYIPEKDKIDDGSWKVKTVTTEQNDRMTRE